MHCTNGPGDPCGHNMAAILPGIALLTSASIE